MEPTSQAVFRRTAQWAYRGRFAPSPTGPLHRGSLVAALASWLDARAHGGAWLVRIEDLDPPREQAGAAEDIIATLAAFGLESDEAISWQHERSALYEGALAHLSQLGAVYACQCSRLDIAAAAARLGLPPGVYPGTCRDLALAPTPGRALRVRVDDCTVSFLDRAAGPVAQALAVEVGDFVVRRADGLFAYQLAVVVDDAAQAISDVVRGADLLDNTPRQLFLQGLLHAPRPRYLHVPVVRAADGEKLSKQNGATALDRTRVLDELIIAGSHLGLPAFNVRSCASFLALATAWWRDQWVQPPTMEADRRTHDG